MKIDILGGLRVESEGQVTTPSAPKARTVLALLALHCNEVVPKAVLVEELWGARPPRSAASILPTYICHLRKAISRPDGTAALLTRSSGYSLQVEPDQVDANRFDALVTAGVRALDDADAASASGALETALGIWRGPVLADVPVGAVLETHVIRLGERRLHALSARIEADLELGRHARVIGELQVLGTEHEFNERIHAQLMVALHRAGRRSEALQVYQRLRANLAADLGLDPGRELERLHRLVLAADPSLDLGARTTRAASRRPPAQLPPDLPDLVGREEAIQRVCATAAGSATTDRLGPAAVTVTGMAGAGKTVVALRAAHRVRSRFPDGQLVATLRGPDGPADPNAVLENFLRALGVTGVLPAATEERVNLFRSWTADRALLVVLDDAQSTRQVEMLSPTGRRSGLVVTSRRRMPELSGMQEVELDLLPTDSALELLARLTDRRRVEREHVAARAIVELCGRLPLAVCVAGSLLASRPGWSLQQLAERLADEGGRLRELRHGDLDVRTAISASVRQLDEAERGVFVALTLGVRTASDVAEALGLSAADAERSVGRLADERLVHSWHVGSELHLDAHPLVRLYAAELSRRTRPTLRSHRRDPLGHRPGPVSPRATGAPQRTQVRP